MNIGKNSTLHLVLRLNDSNKREGLQLFGWHKVGKTQLIRVYNGGVFIGKEYDKTHDTYAI